MPVHERNRFIPPAMMASSPLPPSTGAAMPIGAPIGGACRYRSPGVNVWTAASISGARPKSGTSFAAPFVSAAAAVLLAERPDLTPAQMAEALSLLAQDIGSPGKDQVFGWGLLDARQLYGQALTSALTAQPR
ncbi:MAG: S8 family serine peptidase [Rhizobium sp.]|nr:S8 family serine peptidase [Rhizobium sp.]